MIAHRQLGVPNPLVLCAMLFISNKVKEVMAMRRTANKTMKPVYRVVLLLLMLSLALSLTGCRLNSDTYKFKSGYFGYTFTPEPIMMGAKSNTDIFTKDNVSFELYYGVYDIEDTEEYNTDPKDTHRRPFLGDVKIFFALYICDAEFALDVSNDMEFNDYKNIENYYFLKEISEEEAFSEEYGFNMGILRGITYNHHETISIPAEIFTEEKGSFAIRLVAFQGPLTGSGTYYTSTSRGIELDYEVMEDKVKIKFDYPN